MLSEVNDERPSREEEVYFRANSRKVSAQLQVLVTMFSVHLEQLIVAMSVSVRCTVSEIW